MRITLSVVITCYSEGALILEAIESIRKQTLSPLEIIIVNDASLDKRTNRICNQLEAKQDIKVIWQPTNGGTAAARNAGFLAAKGDVLVPLDADDLLPKTALATIYSGFEQSPDADFAYGPYLRQSHEETQGLLIQTKNIRLENQLIAKPWSLSTNWSLLGTTPVRKSRWAAVGGYDPDFGVDDLHDVEFWIRVIASGCGYVELDEPIYIWRKYLGTNSRKVTPAAWYQIAQKYFDIYQDAGLTYRAYELLLLGSKWLNQPDDVKQYSRALLGSIKKGSIRSSTVASLVMPTFLLRWLATKAQKQR